MCKTMWKKPCRRAGRRRSKGAPTADGRGKKGGFPPEETAQNEEYDALYEQLLTTTDSDEQLQLIIDMQQILIDDAATLVHGYYNSTFASRADAVSGADITPMDYYWITTEICPAE